jgi:hypothetical protein
VADAHRRKKPDSFCSGQDTDKGRTRPPSTVQGSQTAGAGSGRRFITDPHEGFCVYLTTTTDSKST